MSQIQQILSYVKSINERLNLWSNNAKKLEDLPVMATVNPNALLMVSEAGTSKQLEIQKIIEAASLEGQNNTVREVLLGEITTYHDLNYLLDNNGITVTENEIIMLTALVTVNATLMQKQYLWKLGKGEFNPIGSTDRSTKLIELQPHFISEITADELTSSPSAIVYDFGIITDLILEVLNTADPARDYTNDEKIYYIRATKDGINLLYNFIGINDTYGDGESQMTEDDLVLVYSSANTDIVDLLDAKLDKGTYTGDAGLLDNRIDVLESLQDLSTSFIGKAYFIWTGVGLNFNLIYPNYYVEGVLHTGATEPMTLEADATHPRLVVIAVDATGGIQKPGVPSINPAAETLDPDTEIYVTTVFLAAGATTPTGMESVAIYKENAEWANSSELPVIDFDATADPSSGAKHIDVGAFTEAGAISFQDVVSHPIPMDGVIGFDANLKATFSNSTKFLLVFFNGNSFASNVLTVKNGTYGFDRTVINQYQPILVPVSDFTFSLSEFDRFAIIAIGANVSGFKLDNIILSTGVGTTSPLQKAVTSIVTDSGVANATTANDSFTFKGLGGLVVSAVGKVITFVVDFYTKDEIDVALALKEDKNKKGAADGYAPLNEFVKISSDYLTIVNDLVTGGATALASAETVKTLKTQINGINAILTSDNIDLDTVQEIVDAIEVIQGSLGLILVNDLTTGGTTKALTAEMGKTLKGLVDGLTAVVSAKVSFPEAPIDTKQYARKDGAWEEVVASGGSTPLSTDIEGDKNSDVKASTPKSIYDWAVAKFKTWFFSINPITGTSYTISLLDYKNIGIFSNSSSIAFTVPTNATVACSIGASYEYTVQGTGSVTVGGAGITFISNNMVFVTGNTFTLTKIDTDTWRVNAPGVSDMTTTTNQTVSGIKTFLAGKLGIRNNANTFTSILASVATASRTHTLQDRDGILLDNKNITLSPIDYTVLDGGVYVGHTVSILRDASYWLNFNSLRGGGGGTYGGFRFIVNNNHVSTTFSAFEFKGTVTNDVANATLRGDLTITRNLIVNGDITQKRIVLSPNSVTVLDGGVYNGSTFKIERNSSGAAYWTNFTSLRPGIGTTNQMRFIINNPANASTFFAALSIKEGVVDDYAIVTIKGSLTLNQYILTDLNTAPSSATDTGTKGEIRYTSDYIYVCVATNTWKRTALSTW